MSEVTPELSAALDDVTDLVLGRRAESDLREGEERRERRERIATAVLAGFAGHYGPRDSVQASAISNALRWADALIAELDKA